jgi:tetratricopeptide (TPR) repeat protein
VATALEHTHRVALADHHGEIAHHHRQAATPDALWRATEHARAAGAAALRRFAHEDALRWFETALATLDEHDTLAPDPAPATVRLDLLLSLGDVRMRAGLRSPGRDTFRECFVAARRLGDAPRLARAALGFCDRADRIAERDTEVEALLEEALAALPTQDGSLRARLLARLAVARSYPGAPDDRLALSRAAVAMAERIGDDAALTLALGARHQTLLGPDHTEERLSVASRILELARRTGSKEREIGGHFWRVLDLLELGDALGTERELREYARLADELGQPFYQWQTTALRTMRALTDGRFDDAERLAAESAAQGRRVRSPNAPLLEFVHTWVLHRERGTLGALEESLRAFAEALPSLPAFRCALALLYAETDRLHEAREALASLAAGGFGAIPRDENWLNALDECAQACVHLGDAETAAVLYDLLLPYAARVIVVSYGGAVDGPVSRYLGLLATVMGRLAEAELHLERALDLARRLGARPCVAHVLRDQAALLRRRGAPGDTDAAAARRAEAVAIYEELGMHGHVERERRLADDAAAGGAEAGSHRLRRLGRGWEVAFGGDVVVLPDSKGLRCLVELLRNPEQEIHVLDLYALGGAAPDVAAPATPVVDAHVDERAKREYRTRVRELRADLEEAEACNDLGRSQRARTELEVVERALVTAFGLGGRPRRLGDPVERARKAVYNRLRAVTSVLAREHPPLARHLERSVRTGTFCCYQPERPLAWRFE